MGFYSLSVRYLMGNITKLQQSSVVSELYIVLAGLEGSARGTNSLLASKTKFNSNSTLDVSLQSGGFIPCKLRSCFSGAKPAPHVS